MNTSYFAKYKGDKGVAISLWYPPSFRGHGKHYLKLAPPKWLLSKYKKDGDEEFYTEHYQQEILDKLNPQEVYEELGSEAVLLCFEGSDRFCHRHIVARWLSENLKIEIVELEGRR